MSQRPEQPREGALIKASLKRTGKSARKAAREAGMSEGRWRQIVDGYQIVSAGVYAPVRGPAETVARMASVAGVLPDDLEAAGRGDAAAELRASDEKRAAKADLSTLPADLNDITNPTPAEAAMLAVMAAMRQEFHNEINSLRDEVEQLRSDREQDDRDQMGA